MKRTYWIKGLALLLALLLCGCGFASGEESRAFTDSVGRTVTLPQRVERVAVTGPLAQIVVFALAPEKLVGVASAWDATAEAYVSTDYYHLPVLGQLYGGKGELNLEELLSAAPQVVIDVGEPKDSAAEDMDALTQQTGIPFVHITARLATLDDAYRMLGGLLGMPDESEALAAYCTRVYERTVAIAESVEKARLLYITGDKGLNVIARDSYHSEVIDLLCDNLAVVEAPSSKGTGNEADMEQLLLWNPDCILFAPDSIYETVAQDALWQQITAIQTGAYWEVPFGPYNWMGFPPSAQRLLGMSWLAKLLYPEAADYDMYAEAAEYFKLFYHSELTREQYDALVARSLGKRDAAR